MSNLIKQFIAVSDERDERRLKLQLMSAQIDNLRAKNKDGSEEFDMEDDGFLAALEAEGEELWQEE